MSRRAEFAAAFSLLTRLPAAWLAGGQKWAAPAAAVWAYPVVGAAVGGAAGAVFWLASRALPAGLAAIFAIAAALLLTGGLHEDGLADTADGFGGGATAARKLEIMRDSRIGSFGALALIIAVALRGVALASLAPARGFAALVAAGALGRGAILFLLTLLRPARDDGAAAPLREVRIAASTAGLVFATAAAFVLPPRLALACIAGVTLTGLAAAALARQQIGGYTGDLLGATEVAAEIVVMCIVAADA